jgi:hypothetical protein
MTCGGKAQTIMVTREAALSCASATQSPPDIHVASTVMIAASPVGASTEYSENEVVFN